MVLPPDPYYELINLLAYLVMFFPALFLGIVFIPAIAVAGLVFYGASRRKMNPWIWGTLGFFFWIPVGIAYLVVRSAHPIQPETAQKTIVSSFKRSYFWFASFITLMLVFWSLSSSLNILLSQVFGIETAYRLITIAQKLSVSLTVLIITFPIWAIHWIFAQEYTEKKAPEEEKYSAFNELKGYCYVVSAIKAVTLIAFLSKFVYFGIRYLLDVGDFRYDLVFSSLGTAMVASLIGGYHYKVARGALAILKELTPPRKVSSERSESRGETERSTAERSKSSDLVAARHASLKKKKAKFCGQCGTENLPSHKFCSSCGMKL